MKNQNCLTVEQQRFLRACRDDATTLDMLIDRLKLKPWLLSKWLRRIHFRQALAEILKETRRKRRLEFELAARQATQVQSQILSGKPGMTQLERQASYDVLDLYFKEFPQRRRPGRKAELVPPPRSLIHPDVSNEEAQKLLAVMREQPDARDAE